MIQMIKFFQPYMHYWGYWWPQLAVATWVTIAVTVLSYIFAMVLGIILALAQMTKIRAVHSFCRAYIELIRGIPALTLLFLIYFGLVPLGIVLDSFWAAVIGLGMNNGAYMAEVLRAGIEALHKGQREAALSVGMTPYKAYRHIVIPQALRIVMPPMLNMLVILLKDSSICSLISTPELMLRCTDLASSSFLPMQVFLLAGVIYFVIACPLSIATRRLETHMSKGMRRIKA